MDRPGFFWLAALVSVGACGSIDNVTTEDPATQGPASTPAAPTSGSGSAPTEASTDPSDPSTTLGPGSSGNATTEDPTTEDPTTDAPTTGDPSTGGLVGDVHVLYSLQHPSLPAPTTGDLRHVILTDQGASLPTTLLAPPAGGYLNDIGNLQPFDDDRFLSPQGRWAQIHGHDAMDRGLTWLMDIADGAPGVPVPFPPGPDEPVFNVSFTPAEDRISYVSGQTEGPPFNLKVCLFAAGDCADAPVQINPPLPPTGTASLATFAPVGSKLVFSTGDSQVDDFQVLLGDSADPGSASLLGGWSEGFSDAIASFSGDAATVYLQVDATVNNQYEYFAVDVSGDAPGPLVPVSPPVTPDAFGKFAPDQHAFLWFTGDFITGDLDLYELDGTTVTGPFALSGEPGHVIVKKRPPWSPDSRYIAFVSDHESPGTGAVYLVDTSGPKPFQPVKMSAPLSPDGEVRSVYFTPDSARLLYYAREVDQGDNLYLVDIAAPGVAVRINDPLAAEAVLPDTLRLSRDGQRLLYAVEPKPPEIRDLFYVDLAGANPTPPLQINAEDHAFLGNGFSPDGQHAFYLNKATQEQLELYHVDLRGPAPAAPVRLSAEGEDVFSVFIVPPAP